MLSQKKIETLHDAAKAGDLEAAKKLLAEGHDVNGRDKRGITSLGVAVGFNKIPVIQALLEAGADVELTDPKGNTALHYAAGTFLHPQSAAAQTETGCIAVLRAALLK